MMNSCHSVLSTERSGLFEAQVLGGQKFAQVELASILSFSLKALAPKFNPCCRS